MRFRERLQAVLHHQVPDQVPFAPYDNLVPRGYFERCLRNRGMGLLARCPAAWVEFPSVVEETSACGDMRTIAYHTPVGTVRRREVTHVSRALGEGRTIEVQGLIKDTGDLEPVLYMLEHAIYHADPEACLYAARDLGDDGLVRIGGIEGSPYDQALALFGLGTADGLANWTYMEHDYPDHFGALVAACERATERVLPIVASSPAEFVALGSIDGFYGPETFRRRALPFYRRATEYLHAAGKICSLHAHARSLAVFRDLLAETGVDVIEAYTPPPVSDLPVTQAREAWGPKVVIWANIPETIFHSGAQATYDYTVDVLRSDPVPGSLVIGFTETGLACIADDEMERVFRGGFEAVMAAIEDHGSLGSVL